MEDREERLWRQLEATVQLRTSDDAIAWQIFGFFVAANGGLLLALATLGGSYQHLLRYGIFLARAAMIIVWSLLESRSIAILRY